MNPKIIGRLKEKEKLQKAFDSKEAEFIAVYGRRRVGKTFLVREFFKKKPCLFLQVTGIHKAPLKIQLLEFKKNIQQTFSPQKKNDLLKNPENWMEALELLNFYIDQVSSKEKIVLFFDEFPWMVTRKSGLKMALEYYWNRYWSSNSKVKLVICGSSSYWIMKNILRDKGGFHNRVTMRMPLAPFTLAETKTFLRHHGINLGEPQILDLYMCLGGIPFYLKGIEKGLSAIQNIHNLCFSKGGLLWQEFEDLFSSLFENGEEYEKLIRIIASKRNGIDRKEIEVRTGYAGKMLSDRLRDLEETGFIASFLSQKKERGISYKIMDEYSLFYLYWIAPDFKKAKLSQFSEKHWESISQTSAWKAWAGYAFEAVCYKHLTAIRTSLHIPEGSTAYTWRYRSSQKEEGDGVQIDLLFDRPDESITLCEIKYSKNPFVVDKNLIQELKRKADIYTKVIKTEKQIFFSLITSSTLKPNTYSDDYIASTVALKNFFLNDNEA